jgi:hypothetical protein
MEFYARIKSDATVADIQQAISIGSVPDFCAFVSSISPTEDGGLEMFSDWGTHTVSRELIREGLRFTLPGCPNALAWTITTMGQGEIVLHCVINRETHEPDFIETLEQFTNDWASGIRKKLGSD